MFYLSQIVHPMSLDGSEGHSPRRSPVRVALSFTPDQRNRSEYDSK